MEIEYEFNPVEIARISATLPGRGQILGVAELLGSHDQAAKGAVLDAHILELVW